MPTPTDCSLSREKSQDRSPACPFETLPEAALSLIGLWRQEPVQRFIARSPDGKFSVFVYSDGLEAMPSGYTFVGYFRLYDLQN